MPYQRPATIRAVLLAAADYLTRYGWTGKHYLYDDHDACTLPCDVHRTNRYPASILGALRAALCGRAKWYMDTAPPGVEALYVATVDHLHRYLRAPALDWQYAPGRTAAQVIALLRAAARTAPAGIRAGPRPAPSTTGPTPARQLTLTDPPPSDRPGPGRFLRAA